MKAVPRTPFALAMAFLGAAALSAFTMEPMSALLAPSGAGSVATFRIKNEGAERIAVKVEALTRELDAAGEEVNAPAGPLFAVFPGRLVIEPGAQASVKVQWRGPASLSYERCFRLRAEELPLSQGAEKGSSIRVMFRYVASLYVGTKDFAPALAATAVGALQDGAAGFLVELRNSGTRHVVPGGLELSLDDPAEGGIRAVLDEARLGSLAGANYLPGAARRRFVADERAVPGRRYDARIAYEAEY